MIPLCLDQGVGIVPYSPLARGLLWGTRRRDGVRRTTRSGDDPLADEMYGEADFDVVDVVEQVATSRGVRAAQIALAWLLGRPGVVAPVIGATSVDHVDDAIDAPTLSLTDEEVTALEAPYRPHPILGHH